MFVLAGAVIACGLAMLTPYQVTAAPGVDPKSIERRVPPDNVAMYTPDVSIHVRSWELALHPFPDLHHRYHID